MSLKAGDMGTMADTSLIESFDLFSLPNENSSRWHVLHTKSRQEKALSEDLANSGVPHFLPLLKQARHYGRRKIRVALPLFSGYLFVRGTREQIFKSDRAKRLVGIIPVVDQALLNWELKNLNLALQNNAVLVPYHSLQVGTRVEVRSGPFRGLQGLIEARGQRDRLILQVQMLGRGMSLEIEASLLDAI